MENKYKKIINAFIEMGRTAPGIIPDALKLTEEIFIIVVENLSIEWWEEYSKTLSQNDHYCLVKGMIRYERLVTEKDGGEFTLGASVSPISWICIEYAKQYPDIEAQLMGWVLTNRVNPRNPYGELRFNDSQSYADYLKRVDWLTWRHETVY